MMEEKGTKFVVICDRSHRPQIQPACNWPDPGHCPVMAQEGHSGLFPGLASYSGREGTCRGGELAVCR